MEWMETAKVRKELIQQTQDLCTSMIYSYMYDTYTYVHQIFVRFGFFAVRVADGGANALPRKFRGAPRERSA